VTNHYPTRQVSEPSLCPNRDVYGLEAGEDKGHPPLLLNPQNPPFDFSLEVVVYSVKVVHRINFPQKLWKLEPSLHPKRDVRGLEASVKAGFISAQV